MTVMYLRFLWVADPFDDDVKLVTMRFTRVVFGVYSSPFLLNATIKHHLETYPSSKPNIMEALCRDLLSIHATTCRQDLYRKVGSIVTP